VRCLSGMKGGVHLWMATVGAAGRAGRWSFITVWPLRKGACTGWRMSSFGAGGTINTKRSWSTGGSSWLLRGGGLADGGRAGCEATGWLGDDGLADCI
jgi:hypothetical protein